MSDRPHLLHLSMRAGRWGWALECPYHAEDETRPCLRMVENPDPLPVPPEDRDVEWDDGVLWYRTGRILPVEEPILAAWTTYLAAVDERQAWVPAAGCFAETDLHSSGTWDEALEGLNVANPRFPLPVRPVIEGELDTAHVSALAPWEPADVASEHEPAVEALADCLDGTHRPTQLYLAAGAVEGLRRNGWELVPDTAYDQLHASKAERHEAVTARLRTERADLRWLVGYLVRQARHSVALPPRLAPVVRECMDVYDPGRVTLVMPNDEPRERPTAPAWWLEGKVPVAPERLTELWGIVSSLAAEDRPPRHELADHCLLCGGSELDGCDSSCPWRRARNLEEDKNRG